MRNGPKVAAIFYNATLQNQAVSLGGVCYRGLDGNAVGRRIRLEPFIVARAGWRTPGRRR